MRLLKGVWLQITCGLIWWRKGLLLWLRKPPLDAPKNREGGEAMKPDPFTSPLEAHYTSFLLQKQPRRFPAYSKNVSHLFHAKNLLKFGHAVRLALNLKSG